MLRHLFFIVVFLFFETIISQSIQIVGEDTSLPIQGVSIVNKEHTIFAFSNENGIVDLSSFSNTSLLYLSHYAYVKTTYDLSKGQKIIRMRKITEALDEVILSVTKNKEQRYRIAEHIEVVNASEMKSLAPQSSADVLSNTPGVSVQKSQFGGGSPVLRGMESNRVLLVVDGVRLNNAIYRKGHLQNGITVSPSILDRVEVLFGPSSVLYGSDALGGVIHYFTKELQTSSETNINSTFMSRVSSVNNEFTVQGASELQFDTWASYTSIAHSRFGDLMMGKNRKHGFSDWGKIYEYSNNTSGTAIGQSVQNSNVSLQKQTGYSQFDLLQKFLVPFSETSKLTFNLQYSKSTDIPRFDKLTERTSEGNLKFAEWHYGPQKRFLFSTQFKFKNTFEWMEKGVLTAAFQAVEESREQRKFSAIDRRSTRIENVDVLSINGDFSVPLTDDLKRNLLYGFELVHNKVRSEATGILYEVDLESSQLEEIASNYPVQSRYPDAGSSYATQALYTEYRQDLNSRYTLSTGLRYTHTELKASWLDTSFIELPEPNISLNNSSLTGSIANVYKPSKNFKVNTILSSGFRSPNIDDIGKVREKEGAVTVPNIHLKPEFIYNSELGFEYFFKEKRWKTELNMYYTRLQNYIIRAPFDLETQTEGDSTIEYEGEIVDVLSNVNRGTAIVTGGSFAFKGMLPRNILLKGSCTYTFGKTLDTQEYLSSIPPFFGNLAISHSFKSIDFGVDYVFSASKKASMYNLSEGIDNIEQTPLINPDATEEIYRYLGTPSWNIVNLYVEYPFSETLKLYFKTSNIFDRHYKEFASAISAPGRNFSLSLHCDF
ncbi:MAG: TonB-dependent receptor plug domain-containing protein [Flavicella sp.]